MIRYSWNILILPPLYCYIEALLPLYAVTVAVVSRRLSEKETEKMVGATTVTQCGKLTLTQPPLQRIFTTAAFFPHLSLLSLSECFLLSPHSQVM